MSAPHSEVQKRNRKAGRKPDVQQMRAAISENEASDYPTNSHSPAGNGKGRQRRKSTAKKHNTNYDSAVHSDGPNVRQQPAKHHATPIKNQAYAGPTFHQSPAASALPMPSFYSKSLPSSDFMRPVPEDDQPPSHTRESHGPVSQPADVKRETTPLDFLFDAARKAQATPGSESPQHKHLLPAIRKSPSGSPAPRDGDTVFPFEMDTNEKQSSDNNDTPYTPFKDRLEAIRPGSGAMEGNKTLAEEERRAKTAALKNFLMNSAKATELADNPFNAKPAPQYHQPRQFQRHSNPGTPMYNLAGDNPSQQYFPQYTYGQTGQGSPNQRPPGSNLRNIYSPDLPYTSMNIPMHEEAQQTRISTTRQQTPAKQSYQGYYTPPQSQSPEQHRSTPSAQQLEDDLRRVLKLDLTSQG